MKDNTNRELDLLDSTNKISLLLRKYLIGKIMYVKNFAPPVEAKVLQSDSKCNIILEMPGPALEDGDSVTLFRTLGRYIQLNCTVVKHKGDRYQLNIQNAYIAKKERKYLRLTADQDNIYITNIRTSKYSLDASMYSIPTSVKVNFSMNEQKLKQREDFAKIEVFPKNDDLLNEIKKTGKILLLRDTGEKDAYKPSSDDFFDYAGFLGDKIQRKMDEYRVAGIRSEIIYPIKYTNEEEHLVNLGYIHIQNKFKSYDESRLPQLKEMTDGMMEQIRISNTVLIQKKQKVLNISRGGLKISISDQELKEYLTRQGGFSFDLVFKMQAPVTLYGLIRSINLDPSDEMVLGVQISGNSSREGEMKRFLDNVTSLEKKVVERLEDKKKFVTQKNI